MWYVDDSVSSSGDGTSWGTAFKTIQQGIDASSHGDTVIAAEGTYIENIHFNGKNIVLTSTDPLDPDVVAKTVIDGNQAGSVVTFDGTENETCVLSGFTIRNGSGTTIPHRYPPPDTISVGGGIIGGDPWGEYTRAAILNNIIVDNSATGQCGIGGGIANCDGFIANNIIARNTAVGSLATDSWGGGLAYCGGSITNNLIRENHAYNGGGLLWCGGTIRNNAIAGNSAANDGGGLYACDGTIRNNTITGNAAGYGAGGFYKCSGTIRNCIVWANTAWYTPQFSQEGSTPTHSCIQNWTGGGTGNIALNPQFVDLDGPDDDHNTWEDNNYCLLPDSPCIDAGLNEDWMWTAFDLEGNARITDGDYDGSDVVDMGAYEYCMPVPENWYVDDSVSSSGDGTSWGTAFKTIQQGIDASSDGDTVTVAQGTYVENIKFKGKKIVLMSTDASDSGVVAKTIIDGNQAGSVVTFAGTENEMCILSGFTIRNGGADNGGGVYGSGTSATIQNNIITGNSATGCGGGLHKCNGTIRNNTIAANCAQNGGGIFDCDGVIQCNMILRNEALWGGGLSFCDGTNQNNLVCGNACKGAAEFAYGGGLYCCNGRVQNNTIAGNSAGEGGGLFGCDGTILNCIVWGNAATNDAQLYGSSSPTYSCIEAWSGGGEGNIAEDPHFVDPDGPDDDPQTFADNDYRLPAGSPCIDTGKNEVWMWSSIDLDGDLRIVHGGVSLTVDMGAYEYRPFRISQLLVETTGGFQLTWTSSPGDEYVIWSCTDLTSGNWTQEAAVVSGGDFTSWTDPSPGGSRKFYRVELK